MSKRESRLPELTRPEPTISVDMLSRLQVAYKALYAAEQMLRSRDEMNARVHMGETRWSPLTDEVTAGRSLIQDIIRPHVGAAGLESLQSAAYGGAREDGSKRLP